MRESGSDSNMPFEGNSAEERFAQHPANPAMRRFERSPEPRPVKREGRSTPPRPARLQQRTRPSESPRAQKSPLPLRARSLNDRTARPSEPRVSGSIAAGRRNRDSRRQNSLFGFRKPAATAPKDRPEQRRRSRSSRFSSQNSPRPIVAKPFRPTTRSEAALLYGTRLLILGVGVGVIAGTILSIWDPASNFTAGASSSDKTEQASPIASPAEATALRLDQEILPLKNQIQTLVAQQP
ncbi:MAG: hypothetical protein HC780_07385, partial [Leptolyngbyaceae cyanobacterium CSU_1_3]|nr:hypothetical protein [Leptolyngbyaceae cyanobacterium CSU_1_3]